MITLKALLVNPKNSDDETIATLNLPSDYSYSQYLEALITAVGKRVAYGYTLAELF